MSKVEILSRTQRIIVDPNRRINVINSRPNVGILVVNAGPIGPPGINAGAATAATGEVTVPALVWIIDHDLELYPAGVKFFSEDETYEMEPEQLTYVNQNRILATWPEPTAGTWMVS